MEAEAQRLAAQRLAVRPPGTKAPLSEDERAYITALLGKHGAAGFEGMFRDMRLNYNQLTARQLERLCERLGA
jgi:hypothetical protein